MANAKALSVGLCLFLLVPAICMAQAKRIPVAIGHSGNDSVGQGVAFALKEAIRGSQSISFVDYETLPKKPTIVVNLVSVESYSEKGVSSAIGVTVIYDSPEMPGLGIYLSSSVLHCGKDRVESCGKNILPNIDRA